VSTWALWGKTPGFAAWPDLPQGLEFTDVKPDGFAAGHFQERAMRNLRKCLMLAISLIVPLALSLAACHQREDYREERDGYYEPDRYYRYDTYDRDHYDHHEYDRDGRHDNDRGEHRGEEDHREGGHRD
jgi:hypothetical protein